MRYLASLGLDSQNPFSKVIHNDDLPRDMASPMHTFVFSGPPTYGLAEQNQATQLRPVGLVQDLQYSGQKQISPVPELGNRFMRHVPGRPSHSATLSRLISKSANLAGMLYQWYIPENNGSLFAAGNHKQPLSEVPAFQKSSLQVVTLDSDIFDIPFGLLVVKMTEDGRPISANYWERCLVAGVSETISSGQVVIMENVQIVFSRNHPANPDMVRYDTTKTYDIASSQVSDGLRG